MLGKQIQRIGSFQSFLETFGITVSEQFLLPVGGAALGDELESAVCGLPRPHAGQHHLE